MLSTVPVDYFLELFPGTLWDHDSPIQKQTRREQPISNDCQSLRNTRSDEQIPNGNHRTPLTMVPPWDTHLLLVFSFFLFGPHLWPTKSKKMLYKQCPRRFLDIFSSSIFFSCENDFLTKSFCLSLHFSRTNFFLQKSKSFAIFRLH